MEDRKEKPRPEMNDDEKIEKKKEYAKSALAGDRVLGETAQIINLMDSVDKLKTSVEKGTESSNELTNKIRTLTLILVVIGIIALIIGLGGIILRFITLLWRN